MCFVSIFVFNSRRTKPKELPPGTTGASTPGGSDQTEISNDKQRPSLAKESAALFPSLNTC